MYTTRIKIITVMVVHRYFQNLAKKHILSHKQKIILKEHFLQKHSMILSNKIEMLI